jgi:hypothetical protein
MAMSRAIDHPYIVSDRGGEPVIHETRVPVRAIVELWRVGVRPEESLITCHMSVSPRFSMRSVITPITARKSIDLQRSIASEDVKSILHSAVNESVCEAIFRRRRFRDLGKSPFGTWIRRTHGERSGHVAQDRRRTTALCNQTTSRDRHAHRRHFEKLHLDFVQQQLEHSGIVAVGRRDVYEIARRVALTEQPVSQPTLLHVIITPRCDFTADGGRPHVDHSADNPKALAYFTFPLSPVPACGVRSKAIKAPGTFNVKGI